MTAVVALYALGDVFGALVCRDDITKSKPDPEILLAAAAKIGVEPESCVVIEDATNGVRAAKAAGMHCIGYVNANSGNQDLSEADLIITEYGTLSVETLLALDTATS